EKAHPTPLPGGRWGGAPESAPANGVLAASQGSVAGAQGGHTTRSSSGAPPGSGSPGAQTAPVAGLRRGGFGVGQDWAAALELTIATNGAEPYKSRLKELFPEMITPQQMEFRGWSAVR